VVYKGLSCGLCIVEISQNNTGALDVEFTGGVVFRNLFAFSIDDLSLDARKKRSRGAGIDIEFGG
jgi:hypothetical protein